jgi:hypothetical protein
MAVIVSISLLHLNSGLTISIFASYGGEEVNQFFYLGVKISKPVGRGEILP